MSAFGNGGSSQGAQALQDWQQNAPESMTGNQSGLTAALQQTGQGGTAGGDSYQFKLPSDVTNAIQSNTTPNDTAGLTGTQSGMTMPDYSNAASGANNFNFTMPSGSSPNLGGLQAAGGKLASGMSNQPKVQSGGSGRVTMRPQSFGPPVVALPMASGSAAGNSLLKLMSQYRPGSGGTR